MADTLIQFANAGYQCTLGVDGASGMVVEVVTVPNGRSNYANASLPQFVDSVGCLRYPLSVLRVGSVGCVGG